jgi:hypothetical protein
MVVALIIVFVISAMALLAVGVITFIDWWISKCQHDWTIPKRLESVLIGEDRDHLSKKIIIYEQYCKSCGKLKLTKQKLDRYS